MPTAPDRVIEVNPVSVAVDDRNVADSGVPLVLLHGFTGGRVDFADVIDELSNDRRVVAWDRRHAGSTNTGHPATNPFDHLAADAAALVDELALDRFDLLGHSMGGIVAMRYVLHHPSRVRSLILMGTSATPITAIPKEWVERTVAMGRADGMAAVGEMIVGFASNNPTLPEASRDRILDRLREKHASMDVEAFEALAGELHDYPPLLDRLRDELRIPVTVIVGEHDVPLRPAADALADAIPSAVLVVICDAAHSPQEENPEAWIAAVQAHLARVQSDGESSER
jgi:pimeloyl-ACP methyl ester carboxylesterase